MSLAMGSSGTVERSSFIRCDSICDDRDFEEEEEDESDASSSSSDSSIGRNSASSEDSSDGEDSGETEVQSSFKKEPLDTIKDLELDVPVKKGISKFYSGKSKSFTSLADAVSATSVEEIVKPEDPYAKKRKNLLARNLLMERSHSYAGNIGGISKRKANIGRAGASCLALSSLSGGEEGKTSTSISPPCPLPPVHPQGKKQSANAPQPCPPTRNSPWRSYSWSDLQSVVTEGNDMSSLAICSRGNKGNKVH